MPAEKLLSQEKPTSAKGGSNVGPGKDVSSSQAEAVPLAAQAVVGIVASAGGLEAFKQFFQAMPADNGLAFVLIPHLDPKHESYMASLLGKQTSMPVTEAQQGQRLEANHVYVIPPNRYLSLHEGAVQLSMPPEQSAGQTAIDPFLRALAADQQERAVCIVLSGTGSYGSLGLKAIKAEGGMVMVQEPSTAAFDRMPLSAVDTGLADYVLPPAAMPEALLAFVRHFISSASSVQPESSTVESDLTQILALLRARIELDFRAYRKGMLLRRIQRRMGLNHLDRLSDYRALLHDRPDELSQLGKDLLINVTSFFRDPDMFHLLETEVLPGLIRAHSPDLPFRVWVPGCATGEEAYSIAMLVIERCKEAGKICPIQVFATDVDEHALEVARHGIYEDGLLADLPRERLERFFIRTDDDRWQVRKPLRETVLFASQNILADAPFSRMDIVACRNLLIYLEPEVQQKLLQSFHFALNEGGYLILGPSESIGRQTDLYTPVSKKWRIFRRLNIVHPAHAGFPVQRGKRMSNLPRTPLAPTRNKNLADLTRKILLEDYAPAAVVINRRYEVLHYWGPSHLYLQQPEGPPSRDLLALALAALRPRIRAAVLKAENEETRVNVSGIRARRAGKSVLVSLSVRPLPSAQGTEEPLFLIVFQDEPEVPQTAAAGEGQDKNDEQFVRQLESELKTSRDDLQSTIEELESSNEELKASNEEVMSMNEELQSTNEELETSREELQSLNEELTTVNAQLRDKVEELEDANDDMTNLLASVDNATLFLGLDRTIQRFTPSATRVFNLIATDIGRPIGHITARFDDPALAQDIDRVIQNLAPCEREVSHENEQWFLRRITPYRTADNHISGVVLTVTDITAIKRAELDLSNRTVQLEQRLAEHGAELQRERNFIDAILDTVGALIVVIDTEQRLVRVNAACTTRTGYDFSELAGTPAWLEWVPPDERDGVRRVNARLLSGEDQIQHENHWIYRDGSKHLIAWCNSVLKDETDHAQYIIGTGIDITEQREAENRARETLEEASRLQRLQTANELATLLAHELNQPLAAIATYAAAGLQLIARAPLEQDKLTRTLEQISQQSLRAGDAIRHMRAFVGRGRIDPVSLDLNAVVRSTCTLMGSKARSRGVNIVLDLETLPPVMGVDVHIEQVLLNLLRNAIDAIRDAGMTDGTIMVKVRRVDDMAQVSVIDTGLGIDETMAEKVFEPLASHKEYGLGVGLRISRSLIEAHHGRLWVEPQRPGGIFHFILPFAP